MAFQYLKDAKLFNKTCFDSTRDNGFKVKGVRFRLDIRQQVFTRRMVRLWNRLSGETVVAPFLETFRASLDWTLSNLLSYKIALPI